MTAPAPIWLGGLGLLALGVSLQPAGQGNAGGKDDAKSAILRIADAIGKGDTKAAAGQAEKLANKIPDIEDVMNLMRLRTKKGLGVGPTPGAIAPDGIELKLLRMDRNAPSQNQADTEAAALEKMAYVVAAIAEVAMFRPERGDPMAKQQLWIKLASELRDAAPKLAAAAKAKNSAQLQKAAALINNSCNSCHTEFK